MVSTFSTQYPKLLLIAVAAMDWLPRALFLPNGRYEFCVKLQDYPEESNRMVFNFLGANPSPTPTPTSTPSPTPQPTPTSTPTAEPSQTPSPTDDPDDSDGPYEQEKLDCLNSVIDEINKLHLQIDSLSGYALSAKTQTITAEQFLTLDTRITPIEASLKALVAVAKGNVAVREAKIRTLHEQLKELEKELDRVIAEEPEGTEKDAKIADLQAKIQAKKAEIHTEKNLLARDKKRLDELEKDLKKAQDIKDQIGKISKNCHINNSPPKQHQKECPGGVVEDVLLEFAPQVARLKYEKNNKISKQRSVAIAVINNGASGKLISHSGDKSKPGTVPTPEEQGVPRKLTSPPLDKKGVPYSYTDAERKLMEYLTNKAPISGKVIMYVDRETCQHCAPIADEVRAKFMAPGAELIWIDASGACY